MLKLPCLQHKAQPDWHQAQPDSPGLFLPAMATHRMQGYAEAMVALRDPPR